MDALTDWLLMTTSVMVGIIFVKLFLSVFPIPIVKDLAAMV